MILKVQTRSKYTSGPESPLNSPVDPKQLRAGRNGQPPSWQRKFAPGICELSLFRLVIPKTAASLWRMRPCYILSAEVPNTTAKLLDLLSLDAYVCVDTY